MAQQRETTQVATAIDEMSSSIIDMAKNTATAADAATEVQSLLFFTATKIKREKYMKLRSFVLIIPVVLSISGCFDGNLDGIELPSRATCPDNLTCEHLKVPKDYTNLGLGNVYVWYGVHKALTPDERIGSLFYHTGGPGDAIVPDLGNDIDSLPIELLNKFDIVAVDPRGAGGSAFAAELINCAVEEYENRGSCRETFEKLSSYLGTNSVVKDMDKVRESIGDNEISYLGYSYGTRVGALYAQMFPNNVRSMVLDSPMSPTAENLIQLRIPTAKVLEKISDFRLGHNEYRNERYQLISNSLYNESSRTYTASDGILSFREGEKVLAGTSNYFVEDWLQLKPALIELLDNDIVKPLKEVLEEKVNRATTDPIELGSRALFKAVICTDERQPLNDEEIDSSEPIFATEAPIFGRKTFREYALECKGWSAKRDPVASIINASSTNILVIGGEFDFQTPYEWANEIASIYGEFGSLISVSNIVSHEFSFQDKSKCVDQNTLTYLLDPNHSIGNVSCEDAVYTALSNNLNTSVSEAKIRN